MFLFLSDRWFESHKIWAAGLVVGEACETPSHWQSNKTLSQWLEANNVPGIAGIDTRDLTKKIRHKGSILGKIINENFPSPKSLHVFLDPNVRNLVSEVSIKVI